MISVLFKVFALVLLLNTFLLAQRIQFVRPFPGQIVSTDAFGSTESTIPVNVHENHSTTPFPPLSIGVVIKLITHNAVYDSGDDPIPQWFDLTPGTYTWRFELWERFLGANTLVRTADTTITFYVKHVLYAKNNFNAGSIIKDNVTTYSGAPSYKFTGDNLTLGAIDQTFDGYNRVWNTTGTNLSRWYHQGKNSGQVGLSNSYSRIYDYTVESTDNGASLFAGLKKVVNLTFQNNFSGVTDPGVINVNNVTYSAPKNLEAIENDHITYQVITPQIFNNIQYVFREWEDGHTVTSRARDAVTHATCTAYFTGKALFPESIRNLTFDLSRNDRIILNWNEHPNSNVTQYAIWRQVQDNGILLTPQQIGTVNRGTHTTTDIMFKADLNGADVVWYDVRPYFSPDGTWGDPNWSQGITARQIVFDKTQIAEVEEITDYFTGNYPNPFNPSTKIEYHLPNSGQVSIRVYNSIGKEILTLVDEHKSKGKYIAEFDGSSFSSGIYFYEIRIDNNYRAIRKMLLMK